MNNSGLAGPPRARLGPAPTHSGGYPEPANLAPAPPPLRGASRRGRRSNVVFEAEQAAATRSRLARGPGGLGAGRRGLHYAVNSWDTKLDTRIYPRAATWIAPQGNTATVPPRG